MSHFYFLSEKCRPTALSRQKPLYAVALRPFASYTKIRAHAFKTFISPCVVNVIPRGVTYRPGDVRMQFQTTHDIGDGS